MTSAAQWRDVLAEVDQARLCSNPIRLHGISLDRGTGELSDGMLLVPCKDRRAAVCPSCSRLYQADAWQLVAAGIRGGKGVSSSVTGHPQLFVTLTAPSFGAVHRASGPDGSNVCRPRRAGGTCPHQLALSCMSHHSANDPLVGEPLCPNCFDYPGAVLWNAHVSRLWSRTCHRLYREVAQAGHMSTEHLRAEVRLSYIKVVEFQRRGLVHLHIVLRADGGEGPSETPPQWLDVDVLARAVRTAVHKATTPVPTVEGTTLRRVAWGRQQELRFLIPGDGDDATAIAAYVAKYATKTADGSAWLAHPIRSRRQLEQLGLRPHLVTLVRTSWSLGGTAGLTHLRLREHAHTLGYPGQFSSKSQRYSTTFAALRQARSDHLATEPAAFDFDGQWRFAGRGYRLPGARALAHSLLEARTPTSPRGSRTSTTSSTTTSPPP